MTLWESLLRNVFQELELVRFLHELRISFLSLKILKIVICGQNKKFPKLILGGDLFYCLAI